MDCYQPEHQEIAKKHKTKTNKKKNNYETRKKSHSDLELIQDACYRMP